MYVCTIYEFDLSSLWRHKWNWMQFKEMFCERRHDVEKYSLTCFLVQLSKFWLKQRELRAKDETIKSWTSLVMIHWPKMLKKFSHFTWLVAFVYQFGFNLEQVKNWSGDVLLVKSPYHIQLAKQSFNLIKLLKFLWQKSRKGQHWTSESFVSDKSSRKKTKCENSAQIFRFPLLRTEI